MKKITCMIIYLSAVLVVLPVIEVDANHQDDTVHISGRSGVLIEQESGRVLYGKEEHEQRKIASITKIMTAILAIESGKWRETVEVSTRAAGVEGSSLYLRPGEHISLENLTYGLMMRSGNDAAVAIAEHVGGSVEGFTYLMNEKAKEIGMKNSQFTNPHGLDDGDNHYSTAYDMALLMQYAMSNDTFNEVSKTERYRAPQEGEDWDRIWSNKNKLLTSLYEYCIGGKTGYTKSAGRTLVSAAEKGDMTLIAVTLDAPSDWDDHISMYEWAFSSFHMKQIAEEEEEITMNEVEQGTFYLPEDFRYPLSSDEKLTRKLSIKRSLIDGHDEKTIAGKITWLLEDEVAHEMSVIFERDSNTNEGIIRKIGNLFRSWTGGD